MRILYAIFDNKAGDMAGHNPVIAVRADAVALRYFHDAATAQDSAINRHVEDYDLWALGTIDDDGTITPNKRLIITGRIWYAQQLENRRRDQEETNNA